MTDDEPEGPPKDLDTSAYASPDALIAEDDAVEPVKRERPSQSAPVHEVGLARRSKARIKDHDEAKRDVKRCYPGVKLLAARHSATYWCWEIDAASAKPLKVEAITPAHVRRVDMTRSTSAFCPICARSVSSRDGFLVKHPVLMSDKSEAEDCLGSGRPRR